MKRGPGKSDVKNRHSIEEHRAKPHPAASSPPSDPHHQERSQKARQLVETATGLMWSGAHKQSEMLCRKAAKALSLLPRTARSSELLIDLALRRAMNATMAGDYLRADSSFNEMKTHLDDYRADGLTHPQFVPTRRVQLGYRWAWCKYMAKRDEAAVALMNAAESSLRALPPDEPFTDYHRVALVGLRAELLARQGKWEEVDSLLASVPTLAQITGNASTAPLTRAAARILRANHLQGVGDYETAEQLFAEALDILERCDPSPGVAEQHFIVLINRAGNLSFLGRSSESKALFERARVLAEALPDSPHVRVRRAGLLTNLAHVFADEGRFEQTIATVLEGLRLLEGLAITDEVRLARSYALHAHARAASSLGLWQVSLDSATKALRIYESSSNTLDTLPERILMLEMRANALISLGSNSQACAVFEQAEPLLEALPESPVATRRRASLLLSYAKALTNIGRQEDAERYYSAAQPYCDQCVGHGKQRMYRVDVRMDRANNIASLGHRAFAEELFTEALQLSETLTDDICTPTHRARLLMSRALNAKMPGGTHQAERDFQQSQGIFDAVKPSSPATRLDQAMVRLHRAINLRHLGHSIEARRLLDEAREIFGDFPQSPLVRTFGAHTCIGLAVLENLDGRPQQALALLDEARRHLDPVANTDAVRIVRVRLLTARSDCLRALQQWDPAISDWYAARGVIGELEAAAGPDPGYQALDLGDSLFALSTAGALSSETCAREADLLLEWLLDRADLSSSERGMIQGTACLELFLDSYFEWLVRVQRVERIPELLTERFGRALSAERSLKHSGGETDALTQLRLRIRSLNGQIDGLNQQAQRRADHHGEPQEIESTHEEATLARLDELRGQACEEFRRLARARRQSDEHSTSTQSMTYARIAASVTKAGQPLVVLCRCGPGDHPRRARKTDFTTPHAIALVIKPGAVAPTKVRLPDLVITAARGSKELSRQPSGRTHAAVRDSLTTTAAPSATGKTLRYAVQSAWTALMVELRDADEIFIAAHQELGHLPWPNGLPTDQARRVRMFHGVQQALQALEQNEPAQTIPPPDAARPIALLAHSPAQHRPIPWVYADRTVAAQMWPGAHRIVHGAEDLALSAGTLAQISSHGDALELHTGPGEKRLQSLELARILEGKADGRGPVIRALITVACCSSLSGTSEFGEPMGWPVALQQTVGTVLGALHPLDDLCCSLFVVLLHRAWSHCGDLRPALARTREQLRSGDWCETAEEGRRLQDLWATALEAAIQQSISQSVLVSALELDAPPRQLVARYYEARHKLYDTDPRLAAVAEAFVLFG